MKTTKTLSRETWFNAIVFDIQIPGMCNAPIGYMLWRPTITQDSICRTVSVFHIHFPTLRKVAKNRNFSLLLMSLCQNNFWTKIF